MNKWIIQIECEASNIEEFYSNFKGHDSVVVPDKNIVGITKRRGMMDDFNFNVEKASFEGMDVACDPLLAGTWTSGQLYWPVLIPDNSSPKAVC